MSMASLGRGPAPTNDDKIKEKDAEKNIEKKDEVIDDKAKLPAATGQGSVNVASLGGGKDRGFLIIIIIVAVLVVLFVVFSLANKGTRQNAMTLSAPNTQIIDVPKSLEDEVRVWNQEKGRMVDNHERRLNEQDKRYENMLETMRTEMNKEKEAIRLANKQIVDEFKKTMEENLRLFNAAIEREKRRNTEIPVEVQKSANSLVESVREQLRKDMIDNKRNPALAQAEAERLLKESGVPEVEVRRIISGVKESLGMIAIGPMAEPPPSQEEIAKVPEKVRPQVQEVASYVQGIALFEGLIDPDAVKAKIREFVKRGRADGLVLTNEELDALYAVTRVRRQDIPEGLKDRIPHLFEMRRRTNATTKQEVAALIAKSRDDLGGQMSPGQLLSLAEIVNRDVAAGSSKPGGSDDLGEMTEEFVQIAKNRAYTAIKNAYAIGNRDEQTLLAIANRALSHYLDIARKRMPPNDRADLVVGVLNQFLVEQGVIAEVPASGTGNPNRGSGNPGRGSSGQGSTPDRVAGNQGRPADQVSGQATVPVVSGPVPTRPGSIGSIGKQSVSADDMISTVRHLIPDAVRAAGIKPDSPAFVGATIVLMEQAKRLGSVLGSAIEANQSPGSDLSMTVSSTLMPAMVDLARAGGDLAKMRLGLPDQRDTEPKRMALIAYAASKIGPYIHDEPSARKATEEVDRELRSPEPPDLSRLIAKFASTTKAR